MSDRTQTGKEQLLMGERALQTADAPRARAAFHAALTQFRSPDLRLGEAHALRGLSQVSQQLGDLPAAERLIREALAAYQTVRSWVDAGSPEGAELLRDIDEGEAAATVVLGEVLLRVGRLEDARSALAAARDVYTALGPVPSSAGAWSATARLALHEGHTSRARDAFDRALRVHEAAADVIGQVSAWLSIADLERVERNAKRAEEALARALPIAHGARHPGLETRVLAAMGSMKLQNMDLPGARKAFADALPLAREAGDAEIEGFLLLGLGDVQSRLYEAGAYNALLDGTRALAGVHHAHGVATGLLRLGEHALRGEHFDLALLAAEGARRSYRRNDPVRGVGYALRVIVKAFAGRQDPMGVLLNAIARESIAGSVQQNARDVASFYRRKAPADVIDALKPLGPRGIQERAERAIAEALGPILAGLKLSADALDTSDGALVAVEALATRERAHEDTFEREPTTTAEPGILEDVPPEDEVAMVLMVKPPTAAVRVAGPTIDVRDTVRPAPVRGVRENQIPSLRMQAPSYRPDFKDELADQPTDAIEPVFTAPVGGAVLFDPSDVAHQPAEDGGDGSRS